MIWRILIAVGIGIFLGVLGCAIWFVHTFKDLWR